ncbi:MAG: hypothetical protein V4561_05225 [Bacteroidota bacterium]
MQKQNHPSKSFTGNSLYIFAAKFFPALAFSVVWMVVSKKIDTTQYGVYQKFWTQLFVFYAIATIGFPVFILTYAPAKAVTIIRQLNRKFFGYYLIFSGILAGIFALFQEQNQAGSGILSFVLCLAFIAVVLADSLMLVFKSFKALISINFIYAILFCIIHFQIIQQGYDFQKILSGLLILCLVRLAVCIFFIRKTYSDSLNTLEEIPEKEWKKIKSLWIQLGINDIITVLFRWADKFILSFIIAKELFAVYFNGTTEIPFLPILFSAVSSAAVQHWANNRLANESHSKIPLLHYSSRILSSIMFPLFFFFVLFRIEFLSVVFSPDYISAAWIFVCTQLVLPVRAYPFTALLQSEHRGDIINKGAVIDFILACILMYPLYLLMGLPGVALSFVISTYWQAAYYLIQTSKIIKLPIAALIPGGTLIRKFLLYGTIMFIAFTLIKIVFNSTWSIFISGAITLLTLTFVSLWYDWNKSNKTTKEYEHTT